MEKKLAVTLNGKVIGETTDSSDMSTNSLGIETGWLHMETKRFQNTELGIIDVKCGRFFTHNGGSWFEARAEHSLWLDYVLIEHGTISPDNVEKRLEEAAKDWNSTWYKMRQKISTSPKLTITIYDLYYNLSIEEVINSHRRMSEYRISRMPEKSYPKQWARGVLRDLISNFYLREINESF